MATSTAERQKGSVAAHPIEYQMRFRELVERAANRSETTAARPETMGPYLKIGKRLGWAVLDKELVNGLAEQLKLEPRLLQLMDETRSDWFSETLLNLFNSKLVLQHSYVALVGNVVALAASEGKVVIVGRGANLILPPDGGLRVRIIAPRDFRASKTAEIEGIDLRSAAKRMDEIDDNRREFVRRHYRCDATDSAHYDLVVNTGAFGIDRAVDVIVKALELKGLVVS
jgi:hypothetical protein